MASQRTRDARDPRRLCDHRPSDVYTREPCSCGRETWPPRGRGRGESLLSPRRIAAKLRACEAMRLRGAGFTYTAIARALGYRSRSAAWRAIHRAMAQHDAWRNYYDAKGRGDWYRRHLALDRLRAEYQAAHQGEQGEQPGEGAR